MLEFDSAVVGTTGVGTHGQSDRFGSLGVLLLGSVQIEIAESNLSRRKSMLVLIISQHRFVLEGCSAEIEFQLLRTSESCESIRIRT